MAKMNEYMAGREDGLQLALSIVKERGIEGLEEAWTYRDDTCISGDLGIIIFDFLRRVKRCIKRLKELYCE